MTRDLELFGNSLPVMTVSHVAEILKRDPRTIQLKVKELFPDLVVNGKKTMLNEMQVTAVKLDLEKTFEVKSDIEKELLIMQAMQFQSEKIQAMQAKIEMLIPKAELADMAIRDETKQYSITDAGKHLDISQGIMFAILRDKRLITTKNIPTQRALDYGILQLRTNICSDGKNRPQAVMNMANIAEFKRRYIND